MFKRDNLIYGTLIGIGFPAIAGLVQRFSDAVYIINRPAVPYFIAIALNLLLLRFNLKAESGQTAKGVMLTTFVFLVLVIIFVRPLR